MTHFLCGLIFPSFPVFTSILLSAGSLHCVYKPYGLSVPKQCSGKGSLCPQPFQNTVKQTLCLVLGWQDTGNLCSGNSHPMSDHCTPHLFPPAAVQKQQNSGQDNIDENLMRVITSVPCIWNWLKLGIMRAQAVDYPDILKAILFGKDINK